MNASNDDSTRRRWHRRRWLVGLILVTTFLVLAAWIGGPPDAALDRLLAISGAVAGSAPAEPEIGRVEVSVFRTGELEPPLVFEQYRGEVHARRTSSLAMRRSGRLTDVRVHEGDRVNRGDVLAALDVSDLDVQQSLADAEVAAAAAALDEAVAGPREQTVQAAAARVRQLTAQLNSARRRLERQEKLRLKNAGADQELDDARYSVDELRATLAATQAQFDELAEGTRVEQIAAAKAKLAAAEAARQQIDVDRRDSRIVAPFAGVIALRNFDEGEIVGPNQAVFRILEHDPLHVSFGVPPDLAGDWNRTVSGAIRCDDGIAIAEAGIGF